MEAMWGTCDHCVPDYPDPFRVGAARPRRHRACHWVMAALTARGHAPVLVDAASIGLPLLDRMYKEFPPATAPAPLDELADLCRRADGFLIVSGEYNHAPRPL